MNSKIYPRTGDTQTVYLNVVVQDPSIEIGDYTIYNDFVSDLRPVETERGKQKEKHTKKAMRFADYQSLTDAEL